MTTELESTSGQPSPDEGRFTLSPVQYRSGLWGRLGLSLRRQRFAAKYFAQLDAEFEGLCPVEYKRAVAAEVASLRAAHAKHSGWEINHRYEYLLNAGVPDAVLRQRSGLYRERLKQLFGDCPAEVRSAFDVPAQQTSPEGMRAALLGILSEIQRLRHVRSEFERLRNRLFVVCAMVGLALVLFLVLSPLLSLHVSVHVLAAGVLGGYFSLLLRVGALHFKDEYNHNYHQVDRVFYNLLVTFALALFEGGVAACLLYTLFLAGMLEGSIFPRFDAGVLNDASHRVSDLVNALPASVSETAKLLVWSVAAGFCERLVPDILNGFAKERAPAPQANQPRLAPAALGAESLRQVP